MANFDPVAYLYPKDWNPAALKAINAPCNKKIYLPPRRQESPFPNSRQPSPYDLEHDDMASGSPQGDGDLEYLPCLEIRLDAVPKGNRGMVVGCDKDAEIVLPRYNGISHHHFSVTFNANYRLVVKDLGSQGGTVVLYGRAGERPDERPRTDVEWIVGGDDFLRGIDCISIRVTPKLEFQILVRPFDRNSEAFRAKVDRFLAGSGGLEEMLEGTGIRPATRLATAAQTPVGESLLLTKDLGRGGFAAVRHVWDASTGRQYAWKQPREKKPSQHDLRMWRNEALLMRQVSHPNIVKLLAYHEGPPPSLELEYVQGGSLKDALNDDRLFSAMHCIQILRQATSALAYLHGLNITHRDISPGNVLIERHTPDEIFVKLGDLGISKKGSELNSIVGTRLYSPPEFCGPRTSDGCYTAERYTKHVDIWSLGVVLVQLKCELPEEESVHRRDRRRWCRDVRQWLKQHHENTPDDLVTFLLESMLCMEPERRKDAQACHEASLLLQAADQAARKKPREDADGDENDTGAKTARPSNLGCGATGEPGGAAAAPVRNVFEESESGPSPSQSRRPPASASQALERIYNPLGSHLYRSDLGEASQFSDDLKTASGAATPRTLPVPAEESSRRPTSLFGHGPSVVAPTVPQKRVRELESFEAAVLRLKDFNNESRHG